MTNRYDYDLIPEHVMETLVAYRDTGRSPGGGITAVLANDLGQAVARLDDENIAVLANIHIWIYNKLPRGAWGDYEAVYDWQRRGGMKGMNLTPRDVAVT